MFTDKKFYGDFWPFYYFNHIFTLSNAFIKRFAAKCSINRHDTSIFVVIPWAALAILGPFYGVRGITFVGAIGVTRKWAESYLKMNPRLSFMIPRLPSLIPRLSSMIPRLSSMQDVQEIVLPGTPYVLVNRLPLWNFSLSVFFLFSISYVSFCFECDAPTII